MSGEPISVRGFRGAAAQYEAGRPGWPEPLLDELFERLGLGRASRLLDLGAGTGKLTRQLRARCEVIAVEPSADMRAHNPGALDGTAESIPLGDAWVDAVFCAEAFHWFDGPVALAEIHRVLRLGGALVLLWNVPLREPALQDVLDSYRTSVVPPENRKDTGLWRRAFEQSDLFGPLEHVEAWHRQQLDADEFVAQIASRSYMAAMAEPERSEALQRVRAAAGGVRGEIVIEYRTDCFVTTKRGPA